VKGEAKGKYLYSGFKAEDPYEVRLCIILEEREGEKE